MTLNDFPYLHGFSSTEQTRLRKQAWGAWEQLAAQFQARRAVVSALLAAPADSVPCPELAQQLAGVRQVLEDRSAPADVRSRCQVEGDLSAALKIMAQASAAAGAAPSSCSTGATNTRAAWPT